MVQLEDITKKPSCQYEYEYMKNKKLTTQYIFCLMYTDARGERVGSMPTPAAAVCGQREGGKILRTSFMDGPLTVTKDILTDFRLASI